MVYITCMLYVHTLDQKEDWFMIKDMHSDTVPTLSTIHRYLPEWTPFLQYMTVCLDEYQDMYTIKLKTTSNVYEITCYKDKRIISLPKWDTITYIDIIRVLTSIFRLPVIFKPYRHDASYVLECTRTMYYHANEIHLY
jgi:hypothetical protein